MTALADIRAEIERTIKLAEREAGRPFTCATKRFARHERLRLRLGDAAAQSIVAELAAAGKSAAIPKEIDDVPVERTSEFAGFELVIL
jgi:hypothetical protein